MMWTENLSEAEFEDLSIVMYYALWGMKHDMVPEFDKDKVYRIENDLANERARRIDRYS